LDQRRGVHHGAASNVDEVAVRSERCEYIRVDEVARPHAAWRSADQEIGPRRQRDEPVEIAIGRSGDSLAVVIADLHVEAVRPAVRNLAADSAKTEDAQTLAGNGRGVDPPLVLPCTSVDVTIGLA